MPAAGALQRFGETLQLRVATDERGAAARETALQARTQAGLRRLEFEHLDRQLDTGNLGRAEIAQPEAVVDLARGLAGGIDQSRLADVLDACRQIHRRPLRGVVVAQVVADAADDDLAAVQAHAHRQVETVRQAQLVGIAAHFLLHLQGGVGGVAGVILERARRAEQRHDAVAGVLVDRALEGVDDAREDAEEAVENLVPEFRAGLLGQPGRSLDVGEQHRHALALALERRTLGQRAGQVRRRVGGACRGIQTATALVAEARSGRILRPAASALPCPWLIHPPPPGPS